jgi:hypothetical protein
MFYAINFLLLNRDGSGAELGWNLKKFVREAGV